MRVALENARLTESAVLKPLMRQDVPAALVDAVSRHSKWSVRREIRIALLRNDKTPMARTIEFARSLPASELRHVLQGSRFPANIKKLLLKELDKR